MNYHQYQLNLTTEKFKGKKLTSVISSLCRKKSAIQFSEFPKIMKSSFGNWKAILVYTGISNV